MNFTDAEIMALKPGEDNQRFKTGYNGLYLNIAPSGLRNWRFEGALGEMRSTVTIGRWPELNLEQAKAYVDFYKRQMRRGFTPKEIKEILKSLPKQPALKLVKLKDGRLIFVCTESSSINATCKPEYIDPINPEDINPETALRFARYVDFLAGAVSLKRMSD